MAPLDVAVPSPDATVTTRPFTGSAPQAPPPGRRYRPGAAAHRQRDEPPATVRRRARRAQRAQLAFAEPDEKMSIPLPPSSPSSLFY